MLEPRELLYRVLGFDPGKGIRLSFPTREERERFRWRCYSAMSTEVRASKRELSPTDSEWGKHPWQEVTLVREGELGLWLGCGVDNEVQVEEDVPLIEEEE